MKIYSILVTILLVLLLGFQGLNCLVDRRDAPREIATFSDPNDRPGAYKLSYCRQGDLIFATAGSQANVASVTYHGYHGSTEIRRYEWIDARTISIETADSRIQITVPRFKIAANS